MAISLHNISTILGLHQYKISVDRKRRISIFGYHLRPIILVCALLATHSSHAESPIPRIDNASLLPLVRPDREVQLEGISPDWVKSLIIAEFRIETATEEGTFESAIKVLDHYQEMGVNGLWINPIFERGSRGNGYLNFGPHRVEPLLTGDTGTDTSLAVVQHFVDQAHMRNIRVFFDIVVWGTAKNSPLVESHPHFYRQVDGKFVEVWGGYAFDWSNQDLRKWFLDKAVQFILKTGADGFRVDLAPDTSGYFFREVRQELLQHGHKIAIIAEMNAKRDGTFDFEQVGVHGWTEEPDYITQGVHAAQAKRFGKHHDYLLHNNIVDAIQSGTGIGKAELQQQGLGGNYRFYSSNLLHHDDHAPFVCGSQLKFGYTAIFAPFIPMWWIGEEWNNPVERLPDSDGVMFFNRINWQAKDEPQNRVFFEAVKQMIRIRRSYPGIFEKFPESLKHTNICKIESMVDGNPNELQAYARFDKNQAILIIPNSDEANAREFTVRFRWDELQLPTPDQFQLIDLLGSNSPTVSSSAPVEQSIRAGEAKLNGSVVQFKIKIPPDQVSVILVEPHEGARRP